MQLKICQFWLGQIFIWLQITCFNAKSVAALASPQPPVYRYFAYGSNMFPTTMTALRRIYCIESQAAILPGYSLIFDGSSSNAFEPSAAFVVPNPDDCVHGVLYTLTSDDFTRVGQTEGVPFVYRWQRCQVYTYQGKDGVHEEGIRASQQRETGVEACTLVPAKGGTPETLVPPSSSYLQILRDGAAYWKLDTAYQEKLACLPTANNLILPKGLSGMLLQAAEFMAGETR